MNGDSIFNERPAYATDLNRPSVVQTRFGAFDRDPLNGASIVRRNVGTGSAFVAVSMRANKLGLIYGTKRIAQNPKQNDLAWTFPSRFGICSIERI